jgi:hypothetical protein
VRDVRRIALAVGLLLLLAGCAGSTATAVAPSAAAFGRV